MAPSAINGDHTNGHASPTPKIMLYTNHRCPYAHRAHIALQELDLPFEETIIDLDTPRPQWYLDINPRGLVPSMKISIPGQIEDEIIYESAVVSRFLCDAFPSHLLPTSTKDPLARARINFFIDTWESKVNTAMIAAVRANEGEEKTTKTNECVAVIKKEIEPFLKNASPFFDGSEKLTLAEVIAAPQLLRMFTLSADGELLPNAFAEQLDSLPNFGPWAKAVRGNESVNRIYEGEEFAKLFKKKVQQMKAKSTT